MSNDAKPNYKHTLRLPKTDFPMRAGLVKSEPTRLEKWESSQLYRRIQENRKDAQPFILHDGPPFANGDVHMGTALNKILKDLVVKSKTMAGHRAPYVPGWDCHGLPIEYAVVKDSSGLEPAEIRTRCEAFARGHIDTQRKSFRRLGVFGDWDNPYLTLDPTYEADIIRVFATAIEKNLVYSSMKPVQWSYGAQTALAEAEVEYEDVTDTAVYVKFPIVSGHLAGESSLVIWTTTPWTLPANLGIALHERIEYVRGDFKHEDGRVENLIVARDLLGTFAEKTGFQLDGEGESHKGSAFEGASAKHPFLDRESKLIFGGFVTTEAGTGAVHVAPGHGADDYVVGQENGLAVLSPVDDNGKYTDEVGMPEFVGKHVFESNAAIVEILREGGHLLGEERYRHSYPHCWRSKTPIIFRAVPQFFIRIDAIRPQALEEIDRVKWMPSNTRNRIRGTVEARPDWCISRQRTWGVPLPIFFDVEGEEIVDAALARKVADLIENGGTNLWFEKDDAWWNEQLGLPAETTRCQDTLDVWIDSGSSHVAVLDRHPELHAPADLYLEATDQHRGWFQSSLMLSVAVRGTAPYKAVMTHGFVGHLLSKNQREKRRKAGLSDVRFVKTSKSDAKKGKPSSAEHFYSKHGADILRLWVASIDWQSEVPFGDELFEQTGETYRRLRNTIRILHGNLHDFDPEENAVADADLPLLDRWILERLHAVTAECLEGYGNYEFRKVYNSINQFCTQDLSSLYVDITKDRMYCDAEDSTRRRATQTAMARVFDSLCRLLAPILAYTADEAWEFCGNQAGDVHL
ncbi:MAG: isoleucyl-tRNA synthetase, partial [Verrucomicrobiales bacterium]